MNLKGLHFADVFEIQEAVTDKLKKVQKEEFSAAFRNCMTAQKPVYIPVELILNRKKGMGKKSVLKLLDHTVCVISCV